MSVHTGTKSSAGHGDSSFRMEFDLHGSARAPALDRRDASVDLGRALANEARHQIKAGRKDDKIHRHVCQRAKQAQLAPVSDGVTESAVRISP